MDSFLLLEYNGNREYFKGVLLMKNFFKFIGYIVMILGVAKLVLNMLEKETDNEIGPVSYKREYTTLD